MARASDGVEFRRGGVVDRGAVLARIAAREVPLVAPTPPPAPPEPPTPEGDLVPFSTIRKRTAAHLRHSLDTAAHALLVVEIDWSAVDRVRRAAGLTYLPFVARAVVEAARQFPHVNATTTDEGLRVSRAVHLGVAVDLAFEGLVVPVVHDAGDLRLRALASRIDDAATRARSGKLAMADLEGGTFTVTNVGSYGTVSAAPIINHPQVAILSTDGIRMRPVAVPGDDGDWRIAIHPVGNLSLAFDHRAIDGAYAAAFLARVRH
ncbi:MAG: 2-oxoglutarate dehydrogenase, component, dihydrolipoamide succinyltransferase, partial [Acidimicrobiales bacterium]|nr:2-oxoglutarate dehydrogenase, component, dihydrolipoamide succinyltransferase [Acidimicrobiales bacterium]